MSILRKLLTKEQYIIHCTNNLINAIKNNSNIPEEWWYNADVNHIDELGYTALLAAIERVDVCSAERLIRMGASIDGRKLGSCRTWRSYVSTIIEVNPEKYSDLQTLLDNYLYLDNPGLGVGSYFTVTGRFTQGTCNFVQVYPVKPPTVIRTHNKNIKTSITFCRYTTEERHRYDTIADIDLTYSAHAWGHRKDVTAVGVRVNLTRHEDRQCLGFITMRISNGCDFPYKKLRCMAEELIRNTPNMTCEETGVIKFRIKEVNRVRY